MSRRRLLPSVARSGWEIVQLPNRARREIFRDLSGPPTQVPPATVATDAAIRWICEAQDRSASQDGGVASYFSLKSGWAESYPETTGYIIPTLLAHSRDTGSEDLRRRAHRMLEWLVSIQFPSGAFQGGTVNAKPQVPVTFNTGQILLGLAAGAREFGGHYVDAMRGAADWLVRSQDSDGCWRSHPSPFTAPGDKTYETHVAWGLLEAERLLPGCGYGEAALANVNWALSRQVGNGWFRDCCLNDPVHPLTHTLGYALRGCLEGYRFSGESSLLSASKKAADGLLGALETDGFLPGRLDEGWGSSVDWACLTGSVQIAHCWIILFEYTGDSRYLTGARLANEYVRRTVRVEGRKETAGGIKGSYPVNGGYCPYWYPNWAAKFFLDSHRAELAVEGQVAAGGDESSTVG